MENLPSWNSEPSTLGDGPSLESVMADYIELREQGKAPSPEAYLNAFPQHSAELRTFFRNHHWLDESAPPPVTSLAGMTIGPYEIEAEIARGGMGVVYRARQQGLDRPVALKLISSGVLAGKEERRRFRIEAEAAARLHHPGIISIHEIGSWQGHEYFSMTLVDGPTLQKRVDDRTFDDRESVRLARDVAKAVSYAHRNGIIHRDLKPENILIGPDGCPLVTDFGLAKWHRDGSMMTRTGQVLGTPHYMSPEQASGQGLGDVSTDVYSLGAILYALLTGQPPHVGDSAAEVLRSVLQDEPIPPRTLRREIPVDLETICLKAIQYESSQRYPSAEAMADDLERYLTGDSIHAASSGLLDRFAREIRRDQHQTHFVDWGRALMVIGFVIFASHLAIFMLASSNFPRWVAFWIPRLCMLGAIFYIIYRARGGSLLPRSVAERPVWSIWLGYLLTLGTVNLLAVIGSLDQASLFPVTAGLSGFGFVAMAGHVWGGSAICGIGFFAVALVSVFFDDFAPLLFGTVWLISLLVLAKHYRVKSAN
ncbi:MAG: serine/threonine-protein kinase [Rubripirellula sp.]|jgi:serine/threonine protein kinase|nr:serine/threonine protein kinase [Planctomycetaceae bacterium]MDF1840931.1 serine/threonine-protein kinase [Rubripirellula sp.]